MNQAIQELAATAVPRPRSIQLEHGKAPGSSFGKSEIEESAGKLVQYFQDRGEWGPAKITDLVSYYISRGWDPNDMFFGLLGMWIDDGMYELCESHPNVYFDGCGNLYVTRGFVLRCAGYSPTRDEYGLPIAA